MPSILHRAAGTALIAALGAALAGCGHGDGHGGGAGHGHAPLYGGTLVELGDHYANLEVVFDPDAGRLTLYLLDAHADGAVKGPQTEIPLTLTAGERTLDLAALPVVSALAGNEVGSSSEFAVAEPGLVGLERFELAIPTVEVRGQTFRDVRYRHPPED